MKVDCKIYKGIEYVQLSELPLIQQDKFLQSAGKDFFIKIMIDGKIVSQCIQYKDYSFWYDKVFNPKTMVVKEVRPEEAIKINPDLALNKY